MRLTISLASCCLLLVPARAAGQTCTDRTIGGRRRPTRPLANQAASRAYVTTILKSWGLLAFTGQAQYKCADRRGARGKHLQHHRMGAPSETAESDGDWHIELTARANSPTDSCIVLEIPRRNTAATTGSAGKHFSLSFPGTQTGTCRRPCGSGSLAPHS